VQPPVADPADPADPAGSPASPGVTAPGGATSSDASAAPAAPPDENGTGDPVRAFLGLGSNLGDRVRYLRDAVATLREVGLVAVSPVYETDPVGGPAEQDSFLNVVAELRTERSPHELLGVCHRLETAAERVRLERWGPRTLDVDVLWIDGVAVDDPDLVVPHPRMWQRRFVVAPLHDLAPDVADDAALEAAEGTVQLLGRLDEL
jgi:2-amino-4-hydroxy-6-hydroxymethyldihydropteridine diphosphokinase